MFGGHTGGLEPKLDEIEWARNRSKETGGTCNVTNDALEAVSAADVVYTDIWASMGKEAEAEQRKQTFQPYQVNAQLFRRAKRDAIFLHCLLASRRRSYKRSN